MKIMYNYRVYLSLSLLILFIAGLYSLLGIDSKSESFALIAFIFFAVAVIIVSVEEFFSLRPNVLKKLKSSALRVWKK